MPRLIFVLLKGLGWIVTAAGAGLMLVGAVGPWAQVVIFKNVDLSLPGFLFLNGGLCLAVAALVLLWARRSPLICLVAGLLVLVWAAEARRDLPHRVKHQVIGAQMAIFPINRLLDQFHIDEITVGDWTVPDGSLLGPGLTWTSWGGGMLLLGGILSLPSDPIAVWVYARTARRRCRSCGARWLAAREAQFCPDCGVPVTGARRRCTVCKTEAARNDRHCIVCGNGLPD